MSDVKRVTLTTISDVVRRGGTGVPTAGNSATSSTIAGVGGGGGSLSAFELPSPSPQFGASGAATMFGGAAVGKEGTSGNGASGSGRTTKKQSTSVRLELNLFEPTADSFPQFNFSNLIREEQKRMKKLQKKHNDEANGFLSDPELDNDVARVARELELKYGSGTTYASKGKQARPSKLDYCDRGAGYDEEDSFIDNSEAYDELIPQEIETVGGGFYINSGQLEFKQLSNFERPDDVHRMPKPKKRALSTTSESSDDEPATSDSKTKKPPDSNQNAAMDKHGPNKDQPLQQLQPSVVIEDDKLSSAAPTGTDGKIDDEKPRLNGHISKKQKLNDANQPPKGSGMDLNVGEMAKPVPGAVIPIETSEKDGTDGTKCVKVAASNATPVGGVQMAKKEEATPGDVAGSAKVVKTTTVKDMLRAKRDSLRKMEQEKKGRSSGSSRVSSSEAEEDGDGGVDEEDDEDDENDEDDDEEEEDEDGQTVSDGSEKNSNESVSEVDIGSETDGSSRESVSEKDGEEKGMAACPASVITTVSSVATTTVTAATNGTVEQQNERKRKECKLPEDLHEQLRRDVEALKELARTHSANGGGKLNYFDSKVADLLLQIDAGARSSSAPNANGTRNAIFRHLEAHLSISRQSLQLKMKKIRLRRLESRSKAALGRLEGTINDMLPGILAKYELDCLKVQEMRAAQAASASVIINSSNGSGAAMANGEKGDHHPAQLRNPKKRFPWNERTRDLLWELYTNRLECFALQRPRNETEEEHVADYMRTKIVPLWPKGWIRYEDLQKELDRRKKALAKGGGPAVAGKIKASTILSPLTSPVLPGIESNTVNNGTASSEVLVMVGTSRTALSQSVSGTDCSPTPNLGTLHPGTASTSLPQLFVASVTSPNSSHKQRSSDHSISNIMNSPPLPPPAANDSKHSPGELGLESHVRKGDTMSSSGKEGLSGGRQHLSTIMYNRVSPGDGKLLHRRNSREEDSDSSIEIIAEYSMAGVGAGAGTSGKSLGMQTGPMVTGTSLPVLNKEKYKNLIAGKNKASQGSTELPTLIGLTAPAAQGTIVVASGSMKYPKNSPTGAVGSVSSSPAAAAALSFAIPSGAISGSPGGGGVMMATEVSGAVGSARFQDNTPTARDMEVQQIMKDLKEFQELQQQHITGGSSSNRKAADVSSLQPSQQQNARSSEYFIDCDMDVDELLFSINNYTYGGRKN
ncbi:ubinuclein-2 [Anopheles cruzii]|uniref:ubinuclein-2 n=1 Tax=Anopheles cruzii TaxID=68878 RepID=UPI0022EC88B3|nr:ubinuclein-2 [Anopheles cruzii]